MTEIFMPKAGMDMKEGRLIRWLKEIGDHVEKDEPIMEIETDKITMEAEAPATGILLVKLIDDETTVPVLQTIGYIGQPGEKIPDAPVAADTPAAAPVETAAETAAQYADGISIHALREEGDLKQRACFKHHSNFYPRPPRGGRLALLIGIPVIKDFYPRPPRGGRLSMPLSLSARRKFLSTPSARRATSHTRKSMS